MVAGLYPEEADDPDPSKAIAGAPAKKADDAETPKNERRVIDDSGAKAWAKPSIERRISEAVFMVP